MHKASLLCYSNPPHPITVTLPTSRSLAAPSRNRPNRTVTASSPAQFPCYLLQNQRLPLPPLHSTATQEHVDVEDANEPVSVEVGYISNVHGLQGEVRVKPSTDFPELRFSKAGRRWLKQQVSGREMIQEVELVEGRGHPGQKSWILKFRGIDSVDQAKLLIGSTLLVREEERPELEEGEFYTRDLVGIRVLLKETGEVVGTVVSVFDSGASDLLQVKLDSLDFLDATGKQKSEGARVSDHLVWIPFVEAIVPNVDLNKREMHITPPKGLLELNLRFDDRSKKERRQLGGLLVLLFICIVSALVMWKSLVGLGLGQDAHNENKSKQNMEKQKASWNGKSGKVPKRLIAAKKKLCDIEQKHVFHGLRFGESAAAAYLLIRLLVRNITDFISSLKTKQINNRLSISEDRFSSGASREKLGAHFHLHEKGLHLRSEGKVAIILVVNESDKSGWSGDLDLVDSQSSENSRYSFIQTLLVDDQRFIKMEDRVSVPLILVCSAHQIQSLTELFSNSDHFAFDSKKVQFLEEEKLPVVSNSLEEGKSHKILMKSPWEIQLSPVGSGGIFSLLSSHDILENLSEIGVEYIEICSTSQRFIGVNSLLLGFVESSKADIGIQIFSDTKESDENFNAVYSMNFMKKLTNQINELQFFAIPKQNSHVELIDKEWVDVIPSSPNSLELHCTIYGSLNACSYDKIPFPFAS
ncbi:hypothetical protein FNV43_RR05933 [Rhamnella rubrinervis]|uniref:Ribosome maturation factor RimM n=1 Tax=Rhamnella rubrinervis TaxID=2594499 RepID=A0A8K0MKX4_9ROSA|nr:hypothetical protein FNV43_RR05933 [Rhamnella rubrinervis]